MKRIAFTFLLVVWTAAASRAESHQPSEALVLLKRAMSDQESGSAFLARRNVDLALSEDSTLAEAYWLKAQLLAQDGDLGGAKALIDKGDHGRPRLPKDASAKLRADAERLLQTQVVQQTVRFQIRTSGNVPASGIPAFTARLERLVGEATGEFNVAISSPIMVTIFGPETSWTEWKTPAWWGGFFDPRAQVRWRLDDPPGGAAESDRRLRHVIAHAMLHQATSNAIPLWLDEGIAAAWETKPADRARRTEALHRYLEGIPPMGPDHLDAVLSNRTSGAAELTAAEAAAEAAVLDLSAKSNGTFFARFTAALHEGKSVDQALASTQGR